MIGNSLYKRHIKTSNDILTPEELFKYLCLTEMHPSFSDNPYEINRIIGFKGYDNSVKKWSPKNFRVEFDDNNNYTNLFIKIGESNIANFKFDFNLANNHPKSIFKDLPIRTVIFELENGCARINHNIMVDLMEQPLENMSFKIEYLNEKPTTNTKKIQIIPFHFTKLSNVRIEDKGYLGFSIHNSENLIFGNRPSPETECWLPSSLKLGLNNYESKKDNKGSLKILNNQGQQGLISDTEVNYMLPPSKEGYGSVELPYYSKNFYQVYDFKSCYIPGGIRIKMQSNTYGAEPPYIYNFITNADILRGIIENNQLPKDHPDKKEIIDILNHIPYYIPVDMTYDSFKKDDLLIIKVKDESEIDYFKNVLGYNHSKYLFVCRP